MVFSHCLREAGLHGREDKRDGARDIVTYVLTVSVSVYCAPTSAPRVAARKMAENCISIVKLLTRGGRDDGFVTTFCISAFYTALERSSMTGVIVGERI